MADGRGSPRRGGAGGGPLVSWTASGPPSLSAIALSVDMAPTSDHSLVVQRGGSDATIVRGPRPQNHFAAINTSDSSVKLTVYNDGRA
jgi:hypothetical protein